MRRFRRPASWTRREWLRVALRGAAVGAVGTWSGCHLQQPPPPLAGQFLDTAIAAGHRMRDGAIPVSAATMEWQNVDVVIVGGGVAGLAAARHLHQAGIDNFVVLELEGAAGGTARSGERDGWRFPWGAHYLPLPHPDNRPLVELLEEIGIVRGRDARGQLIVDEESLCRDPQERLFIEGAWQPEIEPWREADDAEIAQWEAWQREVEQWARWRDDQGRPAFTLPSRLGSDAPRVHELDRISMGEFLRQKGWNSPRLRWLIDYACRDDYGLTVDQASAWAGLFYFCARLDEQTEHSQPFLTWPEGNGFLVRHLAATIGNRLHLDSPVWTIRPAQESKSPGVEATSEDDTPSSGMAIEVVTGNGDGNRLRGYRARRVIAAIPQFVASRLITGYSDARPQSRSAFQYGAWMVANLFLRDRMREPGFPLAWDNVNFEGHSLGYVVATHQQGRDHGPTVLTWYHALCHDQPATARRELLEMSWEEAANQVLDDLQQVHPDIRSLVTRVDIQRWGHAMIRPVPGFRTSEARTTAMLPYHGIHFAHTDLSGLALFEEAFDHGSRAAQEVVDALQRPSS